MKKDFLCFSKRWSNLSFLSIFILLLSFSCGQFITSSQSPSHNKPNLSSLSFLCLGFFSCFSYLLIYYLLRIYHFPSLWLFLSFFLFTQRMEYPKIFILTYNFQQNSNFDIVNCSTYLLIIIFDFPC